jgi:hypothetical protein
MEKDSLALALVLALVLANESESEMRHHWNLHHSERPHSFS